MVHNFEEFPELTNSQLQTEYFNSPHKQITEDFFAVVEEVTDGDTVKLNWDERDFIFPMRLAGVNTKELNEGGESAKEWMKLQVEGEECLILIDKNNRVDKYGRLLGRLVNRGLDMSEALVNVGHATKFEDRNAGALFDTAKELNVDARLN
jgi:endonuclease YncB( thermonuclease family)